MSEQIGLEPNNGNCFNKTYTIHKQEQQRMRKRGRRNI